MLIQPKVFRLKKVSLFPTLDKKTLYLINETDNGYTMNVGDGTWIGFPKKIVERSPRLFSPYNRNDHKTTKKRKRIFLTRKNPNHV